MRRYFALMCVIGLMFTVTSCEDCDFFDSDCAWGDCGDDYWGWDDCQGWDCDHQDHDCRGRDCNDPNHHSRDCEDRDHDCPDCGHCQNCGNHEGCDDFNNTGPDNPYTGFCQNDSECEPGEVCDTNDRCVSIVENCPLTDECLADPEGYVPEWQGIDPTYVGTFVGDGASGRVHIDVDFYEDHFYGVGTIIVESDDPWASTWITVTITGFRDGVNLTGQLVEQFDARNFDAVFTAELLSASEIIGSVTVLSDEGEFTGEFALHRTSPCGCDIEPQCERHTDCDDGFICENESCVEAPVDECINNGDCNPDQVCFDGVCFTVPDDTECQSDSDCPGEICMTGECVPEGSCLNSGDCASENEQCINGQCTWFCYQDTDCSDGEICEDFSCVPGCQNECCEDSDCGDGSACNNGVCDVVCTHRCQCEAGEACEEGFCVTPTVPPPITCETDCDCDYNGGEICVEGLCQEG